MKSSPKHSSLLLLFPNTLKAMKPTGQTSKRFTLLAVKRRWHFLSAVSCSQPQWQYGTTHCWRCTVCPVWPLLASSQGSYESPVTSRSVLRCNCVSWSPLQTGAAECVSLHWNSWGRSSVLTGDDITWQVFIWLILRSLASSEAPDTCFTSEAFAQDRRLSNGGLDEGWAMAAGAAFSNAASLSQDYVKQRWGKRAAAGDAASLIITLWQVRCFAWVHQ